MAAASAQGRQAALKAWRTRRRRARPTPKMRRILAILAGHETARVTSWHQERLGMFGVRLNGPYGFVSRRDARMTRVTFGILLDRRWIAIEREQDTGGLHGTLPDGTQGIVARSYQRTYILTERGRRALEGTLRP